MPPSMRTRLGVLACSINRFKKIDCWHVHDTGLRHRFLEMGRSGEVLSHLRVLGIEDDHDLTLIAVGGVVDARIAETCRLLHFGMPIEDGAPLAVVPHLMTDNHHAHGSLLLLSAKHIGHEADTKPGSTLRSRTRSRPGWRSVCTEKILEPSAPGDVPSVNRFAAIRNSLFYEDNSLF